MELDRTDRLILQALQEDARIPNIELSERVGLSPSACSRRLRQLEQSGVIEGYQAVISNKALGQTITALVHITLKGQSEEHLRKFESAVRTCPYIVACFLMSGESDYLIRVNARDMEHYEQIYKSWLSALPGVSRIQSSFAMRMVVNRANIDAAMMDSRD
ncbi:MAG: Lrp/AsnC family transcriptional regulator [Salaquimonas sp.]|jgi:DNA-binding Lrp family transcriptional regulator|nr:Lrp/AsnC family transcriptional regulator [Salaquimonas sp.]